MYKDHLTGTVFRHTWGYNQDGSKSAWSNRISMAKYGKLRYLNFLWLQLPSSWPAWVPIFSKWWPASTLSAMVLCRILHLELLRVYIVHFKKRTFNFDHCHHWKNGLAGAEPQEVLFIFIFLCVDNSKLLSCTIPWKVGTCHVGMKFDTKTYWHTQSQERKITTHVANCGHIESKHHVMSLWDTTR